MEGPLSRSSMALDGNGSDASKGSPSLTGMREDNCLQANEIARNDCIL